MFEQAIASLDRAIRLDPDNADAYGNRAVALAAIGEDDLSELDVAEAIGRGAPPDGLRAVLDIVRAKRDAFSGRRQDG